MGFCIWICSSPSPYISCLTASSEVELFQKLLVIHRMAVTGEGWEQIKQSRELEAWSLQKYLSACFKKVGGKKCTRKEKLASSLLNLEMEASLFASSEIAEGLHLRMIGNLTLGKNAFKVGWPGQWWPQSDFPFRGYTQSVWWVLKEGFLTDFRLRDLFAMHIGYHFKAFNCLVETWGWKYTSIWCWQANKPLEEN